MCLKKIKPDVYLQKIILMAAALQILYEYDQQLCVYVCHYVRDCIVGTCLTVFQLLRSGLATRGVTYLLPQMVG